MQRPTDSVVCCIMSAKFGASNEARLAGSSATTRRAWLGSVLRHRGRYHVSAGSRLCQ